MKIPFAIGVSSVLLAASVANAYTIDFDSAAAGGSGHDLSASGVNYVALAWGYRSATKGIDDEVFTVRVGTHGQIVVADRLNFAHFLPYQDLGNLASLEELEESGIFDRNMVDEFMRITIPGEQPIALMIGKGLSSAVVLSHAPLAEHYITATATDDQMFDEVYVDIPQDADAAANIVHVGFVADGAKGAKGAKAGLGAKEVAERVEARVERRLYWRPQYSGSLAGCNAGCNPLDTVPEPSSALLSLIGVASCLVRRRR